eukprot:TRINITY_DN7492_c0_g3_i1.p1 TRINITY_DN7492_c0_g3~~TRINITY_DN7492_c0_g3_i1.p1  ORF type:complete len:316 (-),score=53.51 TRINITY_DN7492_c0_g3_i1:443-1390(-)
MSNKEAKEGGPYHKLHREFQYSAFKGDLEHLEVLMKQGVKLDYKNCHGETALYLVSGVEDSIECLKYLIRRGADIYTRTNSQQTVLHNAAASGNIKALEIFKELGHSNFNIESWDGSTPLLVAAKHMQYKSLVYLLENGANVNNRDLKGTSALFYCAKTGWTDGINLLVARGASLKFVSYADSDNGEDTVHCALRHGHKPTVQQLLKIGCKLTCSNCKRGKSCPRIRPDMTEWFKEELNIIKAEKKGGKPSRDDSRPTHIPSAPILEPGTNTLAPTKQLTRAISDSRLKDKSVQKPIDGGPSPRKKGFFSMFKKS